MIRRDTSPRAVEFFAPTAEDGIGWRVRLDRGLPSDPRLMIQRVRHDETTFGHAVTPLSAPIELPIRGAEAELHALAEVVLAMLGELQRDRAW